MRYPTSMAVAGDAAPTDGALFRASMHGLRSDDEKRLGAELSFLPSK